MLVKICGITTPETAIACFEAGADMIGLVHFAPSQRHLDLPELADITYTVAPLRESGKQIVLLVVDKNAQKIMRILDVCDHQFDFVQFYGNETDAQQLENHVRVLRPVRDETACARLLEIQAGMECSAMTGFASDSEFQDNVSSANPEVRSLKPEACPAPRYVVELAPGLYPGGNGLSWDWSNATPFCRKFPSLLAGGITPENVAGAVRLAEPCGIDVSSGVESSPGVKNMAKVKQLIQNAKMSKT